MGFDKDTFLCSDGIPIFVALLLSIRDISQFAIWLGFRVLCCHVVYLAGAAAPNVSPSKALIVVVFGLVTR